MNANNDIQKSLVSIIIPNYNHTAYLKKRLDSVFNQSFQNFEVILLDDASTDGSQELLVAYKDHPKVSSLVLNQTNSGSVFRQWVKGLSLARGEYVWIAESDDYSHFDFLKFAVAALEENPKTGLAFSNSILIDEQGIEMNLFLDSTTKFSIPNDQITYVLNDQSNFFSYYIHDLVICNVSSVLFKRKALESVDYALLETFKNAGDLFVYISMALQSQIIYINKPLNYFRKHLNNITKSNTISGVLHSERVKIVAYFSERLITIYGSKQDLKLFLKRHFLTTVERGFSRQIRQLLKKLYIMKVLGLRVYLKLTLFSYLLGKKLVRMPFGFRKKAKMELENLLMD